MNLSLKTNDCFFPLAHGVALITINAIVGVLGSLGNLLVCSSIATNPRLRRGSNYLLFSLAIADLIVTAVCEPFFLESLCRRTFFHKCATNLRRPYFVFVSLSLSASMVHMASISVDRVIAVVFPLHHKTFVKKWGLKAMLIISWAIAISYTILRFVLPPTFPWAFLAMGVFAFSYFLVILSYFLIVVFLFSTKRKRNQLRARQISVDVKFRVEVRVACTVAIVIGVFTSCWVPMVIARFATGRSLIKPNGPVHMWFFTLALSNSAMNFLIYSAKIREFRDAYVGIFRKMCHLLLCQT